MSEEMHRDFCPRCAVKHLGKAAILMKEAKLGYPHHVWYAMANMSEAEDEIVDMMPKEAELIRKERIEMQAKYAESEGKELYTPDFTKLMYMVGVFGMLEEAFDMEYDFEAGTLPPPEPWFSDPEIMEDITHGVWVPEVERKRLYAQAMGKLLPDFSARVQRHMCSQYRAEVEDE